MRMQSTLRFLLAGAVSFGLLAGYGCQKKAEEAPAGPETSAQQPPAGRKSGQARRAPERLAARPVTVPAGATLSVRTSGELSTKTVKPGDPFQATLQEPLSSGGIVIAGRGADVEGVVTEADPGGRVKGLAVIAVKLTRLTAADGSSLPLSTGTFRAAAHSTRKKDAAKVGIGAGIGAAIGAIAGGGKGAAIGAGAGGAAGTGLVLATRGDAAVIPAETPLAFTLSEPLAYTPKR